MSKFGLYTSFFKTSRGEIGKRPKKAKNTGFGKIKTCLALNWVIRLRPKFTTFQFLISSVVPQKIGSTALLLFRKFPKDRSGPIKDRRTDWPSKFPPVWPHQLGMPSWTEPDCNLKSSSRTGPTHRSSLVQFGLTCTYNTSPEQLI